MADGHLPQKDGLAIRKVIDRIDAESHRKEPSAGKIRSLGIQLAWVADKALTRNSRNSAKEEGDEQG